MAVTEKDTDTPVPGPDTFDLNAYLKGKSTFPVFDHTVFLDQDSGIRLDEAQKEFDSLTKKGSNLLRKQRAMSELTSSLVNDEAEKIAEELDEIQERTDELEQTIQELRDKIVSTSITLTFQVGTSRKLGKVFRRAEKEYQKLNGRGSDKDPEYLSGKANYLLVAQLVAYCTKVFVPDHKDPLPPPSKEWFENLLESLIPSEENRLMVTLNNRLASSAKWAESIDAGFPGGGDDLGLGTLDGSGPEGGPFLGDSPDNDADGGEDQLV